MIGILSRVKKLFDHSQPTNPPDAPRPAPELIDLTAPSNRKRKLDDCARTSSSGEGSKRQRMSAIDNIDREEDIQILHVQSFSDKMLSPIFSLAKWFSWSNNRVNNTISDDDGSDYVPPRRRKQTKDDLNDNLSLINQAQQKPPTVTSATASAGQLHSAVAARFQAVNEPAAAAHASSAAAATEVEIVKVVSSSGSLPLNEKSSFDESREAMNHFKFEASPINNKEPPLTDARKSSSIIPRFKLMTRKERNIQSHKNKPKILASSIKLGKRDRSVFSKIFSQPSPSRGKNWSGVNQSINKEAKDLYRELLMRNTSTFLPTFFEKPASYSSYVPGLFKSKAATGHLFAPSSISKKPGQTIVSPEKSTTEPHVEIVDETPDVSVSEVDNPVLPERQKSSIKSPILSPFAPGKSFVESTPLVKPSEKSRTQSSLQEELQRKDVYSKEFLNNIQEKYSNKKRELDRQIRIEEKKKSYHTAKNEELYRDLDERILRHLKLTSTELEVEPFDLLEDDTTLPEITPEMEETISRAFKASGNKVLVEAYRIPISAKDLATLKGLNWLNDEVINFYMQMIAARGDPYRVHAFNTFFYSNIRDKGYSSVKRWTKKVDIFAHDIVLVPVHLGMHWCLATIDIKQKSINYYDSMGGNNNQCVELLLKYIKEEHMDKKKTDLDTSDWKVEIHKKIPQQMNGSDCGMFTCKFAEYISRRAKITFTQSDMPYFRRRMVYEIVENKLLKP